MSIRHLFRVLGIIWVTCLFFGHSLIVFWIIFWYSFGVWGKFDLRPDNHSFLVCTSISANFAVSKLLGVLSSEKTLIWGLWLRVFDRFDLATLLTVALVSQTDKKKLRGPRNKSWLKSGRIAKQLAEPRL